MFSTLPSTDSSLPSSAHRVFNPLNLVVEVIHGVHLHAVLIVKVKKESVDSILVVLDELGECKSTSTKVTDLEFQLEIILVQH